MLLRINYFINQPDHAEVRKITGVKFVLNY